jgi:hypothetical protein
VSPVFPGDGDVVGPRTVFEIGYEVLGDPPPRRLRFRIRLEPVGDRGTAEVFDQRRRPSGWLVGEPGRVLYRPRRDLADGEYRWETAAWNGVNWVVSRQRPTFRVDSVPPADVEDLRLEFDRSAGRALLEWPPVTSDREGRPEFVARYHVYRYEERGPFRRVRPHEVAVVEQPTYVDTDAALRDVRILFYRVTAEDEAGNEGGR